ncbi:hypothetical protein E2C01_026063 [Portunus trituberculatus]|uniref:Uncharacterized protein n=1 Tax=Portunus trituberculatus TaxID=210409 RepID=A0A5B7EHU7_PORTR|nr:hypothetical protein [Portunus trituberculatus]
MPNCLQIHSGYYLVILYSFIILSNRAPDPPCLPLPYLQLEEASFLPSGRVSTSTHRRGQRFTIWYTALDSIMVLSQHRWRVVTHSPLVTSAGSKALTAPVRESLRTARDSKAVN